MLQNTVRLFWQTRHTFLVALAKIRDYETTNGKFSRQFCFKSVNRRGQIYGSGKTKEQIKLSVAPVALNTVLLEKINKLRKQTSVVADFRR